MLSQSLGLTELTILISPQHEKRKALKTQISPSSYNKSLKLIGDLDFTICISGSSESQTSPKSDTELTSALEIDPPTRPEISHPTRSIPISRASGPVKIPVLSNAYNFSNKMRPHIASLGACLGCLLSTGGHVHVGLAGKKRRLSLGAAE